jgi:hypothetical protein
VRVARLQVLRDSTNREKKDSMQDCEKDAELVLLQVQTDHVKAKAKRYDCFIVPCTEHYMSQACSECGSVRGKQCVC